MPISVDVFGGSDIGSVREANEDHFIAGEWSSGIRICSTNFNSQQNSRLVSQTGLQILAVADGMGGHAAGQLASSIVLDSFLDYLLNTANRPGATGRLTIEEESHLERDLLSAVRQCQDRLNEEASEHPQHAGMGSTLTAACIFWPCVFLVHVGDSRCYLLRNNVIEQLTTDHTLLELYVSRGEMSKEEAKERGYQHRLHNVLAAGSTSAKPDFIKHQLKPHDRLLVCSDGLTKHVNGDQLANIIGGASNAKSACEHLIKAALADGGTDNVSVAVAIAREATDPDDDSQAAIELADLPTTREDLAAGE